MEGVTTAIVAFIFVGLILPSLIQNKNQYYIAFIAVIGIIFFEAIAHMGSPASGFTSLCYVITGILQIIAVVMLFLATGGLSFRALQGDMIEVLRRGQEEKEVIIPLSEEAKQKIRQNQEEAATRREDIARRAKKEDAEPQVFKIDDPAPANPPPPPKSPSTGPLPLD